MFQPLSQLKKIVEEGRFEAEDRQYITDLETQLQEAAATEKIAELPVIAKFIDYMEGQIEQANSLLQNDKTLTDRQRDALFERKELCAHFVTLFTGKERESVEDAIKQALANAQG